MHDKTANGSKTIQRQERGKSGIGNFNLKKDTSIGGNHGGLSMHYAEWTSLSDALFGFDIFQHLLSPFAGAV